MIKVIVVDDQEIMRQGLSMILASSDKIEVVGVGENGEEAIKLCEQYEVDVVLLDINMPVMNGVDATKEIHSRFKGIKVLVLTTFNDEAYIFGTLKNGASGYLLKDASPEEIINGVITVHAGGTLMNDTVASKVFDQLDERIADKQKQVSPKVKNLTTRELDICHYLGEGLNNKEIGEALFISEGTVKNNITRILDKLELRDRTQLALFSVKNDI